jgi:hypothetical protein
MEGESNFWRTAFRGKVTTYITFMCFKCFTWFIFTSDKFSLDMCSAIIPFHLFSWYLPAYGKIDREDRRMDWANRGIDPAEIRRDLTEERIRSTDGPGLLNPGDRCYLYRMATMAADSRQVYIRWNQQMEAMLFSRRAWRTQRVERAIWSPFADRPSEK